MIIPVELIAQASAERMGYCLVEGALVTAFASCLLRVVPGRNAGTRFAVWFSALVAIAALPLFGSAGGWGVRTVQSGTATSHAAITLPGSWALYVFGVWAALAGLALARVGAGFWQLYALRKSCVRVDASTLDPMLREALERWRQSRRVEICTSERVHAPVAIGFAGPAVVLPKELMEDLSTPELRQILLHELAHLRRWDDWTNLVQKIVKALLFFHPAVWWIERRVSLERVIACDDAVLKETASPRAYAECLTHLAEKNLLRRSAALAQAAVSRLRQTSLRVARILDGNRPAASTQVWKPAVPLVAVFALACVALLVHAPKLVAFEDRPPNNLPVVASTKQAGTVAKVPGSTLAVAKPIQARAEGREPIDSGARVAAKVARPNMDSQRIADLAFFQNGMEQAASGPTPVQVKDSDANHFVVSETYLLVVEGNQVGSPNPATYQICVWCVTVLRLRSNPASKKIQRKVT